MSTSDTSGGTGGGGAPGPGGSTGAMGIGASSSGSGVTTGGTATTGEHLKIIKTQLIPHHPSMLQQQAMPSSPTTTSQHTTTIATTTITPTPIPPHANNHHATHTLHATTSSTTHLTAHAPTIQLKNAPNLFSLNPVAAKITHVKTSALDGTGGLGSGLAAAAVGGISIGTAGGSSNNTILTSGGAGISTPGGIKVATGGTVTTSLALNNSQSTTATAIRAIGTGGQSTQVRVVMPTAITSSMLKQLEGAAVGRAQITAIPAATARTVSNTSITVTRPITQTTYLPRAAVTATQMTGMGVAATQRLVTPIRTTTNVGATANTVAGLTAAGSFVRSTAVNRNPSSPATTVISPATSTTWMAANTAGHVQLIRTISHQSRQRIITTQGISQAGTGGTVASAIVGSTSTPVQSGIVQGMQSQQQVQGGPTTLQTVSSQSVPHSQHQQQQQQTYVATLATVLPPRQHPATLVYSNVATSQPLSQSQQFSPTVAAGQRFTVATPLSAATGTGTGPRQIRPIPLGKSFSTAKLNTTSISIRAPNIPLLTPTLGTGGITSGGAVVTAANSPRSTTVTGVVGSTGNVIPTTNLSTTRIIQLQQQPGGATQQIIGSTGRLAGNVMLQPIIVNTSGGGKIGLRPPVSMATKVQPALTITQLGIGKLPGVTANSGSNMLSQQSVSASIQALNSAAVGVSSSLGAPTSLAGVSGSNLTSGAGAQLVNVSQGAAGQLLTTQNIVSSAGGATVVPLAITTRGASGGNILTGTITPLKNTNSITVGKVMTQAQVAAAEAVAGNVVGAPTGTSVYIHHTNTGNSAPQRPHSGSGATLAVATSTPISSACSSVSSVVGVSSVNTVLTSTCSSSTGGFLPPGSTIYYESVPASSVQVSTGVLSLATTTVTSSTHTQNQLVSSAGAGLAISSLPYATHAGNSTATFTVVPSSGARTISQLQIPVSSAGTQIQAVPVRFSAQLGTGSASGGAVVSSSVRTDGITVSQATLQPTELLPVTVANAGGHQIIIPAPHQGLNTNTLGGGGGGQHMIIPLPTSIKVTSAANQSAAPNSVPSFLRKRDTEGSPKRAAKNLGPALLSISANILNAVGSPAASSVGSSYSMASTVSSCSGTSALTTEALAKKERAAAAAATTNSARSSRAESPASSDGSTTVSANSSPGVDQQILDGNLVINRIPGTSDATHFNPINELYSNHHSISMPHNLPNTPASSRISLLEHAHVSAASSVGSQRMNGGPIDCPPRKKSRRSTNDSQHSAQSQTSFSLPAPAMTVVSNSLSVNNDAVLNNGILLSTTCHDGGSTSAVSGLHHKVNNVPLPAGNKENAKPTEFILRRPSSCTLLNGYKQTWKPANNHFQRYSDIKPREERRPTVIDLANQANVLGKINGWKIYHLRSQMEDLCENESLGYEKLSTMLKQMEGHENNPEIERVNDLLKGNMQRSKIIVDGVNEAQNQIMKIFEHKSHISDIIHRCASKRNFKKREKV